MSKTISLRGSDAITAERISTACSANMLWGVWQGYAVPRALKVKPVLAVAPCIVASFYRSGLPSKRIALTALEVSALRLAAHVAGLI